MGLSAASLGFGFAAGLLSILSPCVLPLLPLVLGPAIAAGRLGAAALAAGLVTSFVGLGLFVATLGYRLGLDGGAVRDGAAVLLALAGLALLSEGAQQRLALAMGGISDAGNRFAARLRAEGTGGQFVLGLLLGAIWSPCVGPTLGAASLLAAQGRDLGAVASVMAAFGLGAATPLLLVGLLSREAMLRWRGRMMSAGRLGKAGLGAAAVLVAVAILTGADRRVEAALVSASPAWLTDLTTRY